MNILFLLLFSLLGQKLFAASCCVSNTSVSNLMILPADWQQTIGVSQGHVIGDVDEKGQSTFRRKNNKDVNTLVRADLSYAWTPKYQSGVSLRYQERSRELNGVKASESGWNDVGLSHAYKPFDSRRLWVFQTLNVPTATSTYDANSALAVDARGTGTYITSIGAFGIVNSRSWDFTYAPEVHRSFGRTFRNREVTTEVEGFWGASFSLGGGFVPWRSKARYGVALTPRYEGAKNLRVNGNQTPGKDSLVWDASVNFSYTFSADYALGMSYTDQTIMGPSHNTLLNRSMGLQFQTRWH